MIVIVLILIRPRKFLCFHKNVNGDRGLLEHTVTLKGVKFRDDT